MSPEDLAFVTVDPDEDGFTASVSMEGALSTKMDLEVLLGQAAQIYEDAVTRIRSLVAAVADRRLNRKPVPARMIWHIGDGIFSLTTRLARVSLQLDNLYGHLMRDLRVRRMWLEKVIIFRRYLPKKGMIPSDLRWGRCSRTPRKVAELLRNGRLPE